MANKRSAITSDSDESDENLPILNISRHKRKQRKQKLPSVNQIIRCKECTATFNHGFELTTHERRVHSPMIERITCTHGNCNGLHNFVARHTYINHVQDQHHFTPATVTIDWYYPITDDQLYHLDSYTHVIARGENRNAANAARKKAYDKMRDTFPAAFQADSIRENNRRAMVYVNHTPEHPLPAKAMLENIQLGIFSLFLSFSFLIQFFFLFI